ncbi:MAG: sugar ABC transporter ATP-binding protein, partial [Alphaproteobacteria bacterium HGW-Alphaproteobacteria-8]
LAVLLVSHNLEHVFRVADRIAVMHRGAISAIRPTAETSRAEIVGLIMGSTLVSADPR